MDDSKVFMFPEGSSKGSIDPALLMALNNNGGFGNNGAWIWILFMWMMWQNGGKHWGKISLSAYYIYTYTLSNLIISLQI